MTTSLTTSPTTSTSVTTQQAQLEHVNVTVSDPIATADMLGRVFGWHVRWKGESKLGGTTVHVGTETQYLAVYCLDPNSPQAPDSATIRGGLNHVAVVVADLDAAEARILAEGFQTYSHGDYEPGRRFYFDDHDGIEFEVVSYVD